jgi:hypothetical protein
MESNDVSFDATIEAAKLGLSADKSVINYGTPEDVIFTVTYMALPSPLALVWIRSTTLIVGHWSFLWDSRNR